MKLIREFSHKGVKYYYYFFSESKMFFLCSVRLTQKPKHIKEIATPKRFVV